MIGQSSFQWHVAKGGVVMYELVHLKFRHPDLGNARNPEEAKSATV